MKTGDRSFSDFLAEETAGRGCSGRFQGFTEIIKNAKTDEETGDQIFPGESEREIRDVNCAGKMSEESFTGGYQVSMDVKWENFTAKMDERKFCGDLGGNSDGKTIERSFYGGSKRIYAGEAANRGASGGFQSFEGVRNGNSSVGRRFSGSFGRELHTTNFDGNMDDRGLSDRFKTLTKARNGNSVDKTDESDDFKLHMTKQQIFSGDFLSTENLTGKMVDQRFSNAFPGLPELHAANPVKNLPIIETSKFGAKTDERSTSNFNNFGFDHGSESDEGVNLSKIIHSQVLKIREEDSHLGEDIGEGGFSSTKDKFAFLHLSSHMKNMLFYSRPILPSPLGTKTTIHSFQ